MKKAGKRAAPNAGAAGGAAGHAVKRADRDGGAVAAWDRINRRIVRCAACPRLREHCAEVAQVKRAAYRNETYWGRPAPNFGDPAPGGLLVVGLAPAAHGANRTGRLFTGDRSGDWLFRAMHRAGFASQATAVSRDDGLSLHKAAITGACHCAPPGNKPTPHEIANCRPHLEATWDLARPRVVVALGGLAWTEVFRLARERGLWADRLPKFGHLARVTLADGTEIVGSFHPSQQNTFTGRLTETMLDAVFEMAQDVLRD